MTALLALPVGLMIGLSLGALGAGGSILTVPALVYLLGQSPHQATTTSLVIVGASALAGAVAHGRAGRVRLGPGVAFGLLGAAGSVLGSKASAATNPEVLLVGFAGLMVAAAAAMLVRRRRRPGQAPEDTERPDSSSGGGVATLTRPKADSRTHRGVKVAVAATVVGLLTGFFGVGGGFVVVPALVLALGYDTATAVGTSLVVITINSAIALATRLGTGSVTLDWTLLGLFTATAVVGVLMGNRIASRVAPDRLTTAFALMLLALAGYTVLHTVTHLV